MLWDSFVLNGSPRHYVRCNSLSWFSNKILNSSFVPSHDIFKYCTHWRLMMTQVDRQESYQFVTGSLQIVMLTCKLIRIFFLVCFYMSDHFYSRAFKENMNKKNINIHSFLCWIIIKRFISVKIIQNKNPSCFTDLAVISHVPSSRRSAPVSEHSAVR